MTTITAPVATISRDRWFFTGITVAMMLTAFAGFAPSFYLRSASHAGPPLTTLVIFHGMLMTAWMLANVLQTVADRLPAADSFIAGSAGCLPRLPRSSSSPAPRSASLRSSAAPCRRG